MKVVLLLMLWAGALVAGGHGVTARFVPEQVRPGEVFELRVEMARSEYGRFVLKVPPHGSLHRVAVESEPLRLVNGVYRQAESWVLQADRAGEIVIENAVVVLTTDEGDTEQTLPPLRMEVVAWGTADESVLPVAFPRRRDVEPEDRSVYWLCLVSLLLLIPGWWQRLIRKKREEPQAETAISVADALVDLEAGVLRSGALERLMVERRAAWPVALREAVEEAVYAGRGDAGTLAAMLRKEVAK